MSSLPAIFLPSLASTSLPSARSATYLLEGGLCDKPLDDAAAVRVRLDGLLQLICLGVVLRLVLLRSAREEVGRKAAGRGEKGLNVRAAACVCVFE